MRAASVMLVLIGLAGAAGGTARAAAVTPEVRLKEVIIPGHLQATTIVQSKATSRLPALLACYRANLSTHRGEVGPLGLRLQIQPTGRISKVTVLSSGVNTGLQRCVVGRVRTWTFTPWKEPQKRLATLRLVFQLSATPNPRASVSGGIPARLVAGTVETHLPRIRRACLKGREGKGQKKGDIFASLEISARGTVRSAAVLGRVKRSIKRCLSQRMRRWKFPPADQSIATWVRYPLRTAGSDERAPRPRRRPHSRTVR